MASNAQPNQAGGRTPFWDGQPQTFHHYIVEIKWYLAGTKTSDRPYAAARLVRRLLESDYPALKTLMYKLDPDEFRDENSVQQFIRFLENSPMNRQPIPDAGAKLAAYYRKLSRKTGESIPQFLIREDTVYDEMWRSLQRLLREKELDFSKFDTSLEELRSFCGMDPERSMFYPEDLEEEEAARRPTPAASVAPAAEDDAEESSSRTATPIGVPVPSRTRRKPKDLIERLMEKGLIPLAAMDIIRGWLVLEMSSSSDMDRALVKASAQNKFGYDRIKASLLALHQDRGRLQQPQKGHWKGGRMFMAEEYPDDPSWYGDFPDGDDDPWHGEYPDDYGA